MRGKAERAAVTMEEEVFRKIRIQPEKLEELALEEPAKAGEGKLHVRRQEDCWLLTEDFMKGAFTALLTVDDRGRVTGRVIEKETGEEYMPLRVRDAGGAFVSEVRQAYRDVLTQIAAAIGVRVPFTSDQANRIADRILAVYGDAPDFPWKDGEGEEGAGEGEGEEKEKEAGGEEQGRRGAAAGTGERKKHSSADAEDGVFRHPDSRKWYGLVLRTDEKNLMTAEEKEKAKKAAAEEKERRKRERLAREEARKAGRKLPRKSRTAEPGKGKEQRAEEKEERHLDILNLKVRTEDRERIWKIPGVYPAFHMSQKTWISVRLDDTLTDDAVMELVESSYRLTDAKGGRGRSDGRRVWIVPANPKYYDIVGAFTGVRDTIWKQGKGIQTGDTVYMYVAVPYSAILYRCTVTKAHAGVEKSADGRRTELMDIRIEERYDRDLCTLEKMKAFHVTTVRGPRFMPEDLEAYIRENRADSGHPQQAADGKDKEERKEERYED